MKTSIIIPTYNRAPLLPRAVASIPDTILVEIIIIDDGSTDNTREVVQELMLHDNRIVFITLSENHGVNYARNRGVEVATSEWVQLLDSDDAFVVDGTKYVSALLDTIPQDILVVGFMTLREVSGHMEPRGYRVGKEWKECEPTYEDILLKRNIFGDIHYCIRRSVFEDGARFFEDTRAFESEFFSLLAKHNIKFLYINKVVDQRYYGAGYHLSNNPFKKYPRSFARGYKRFVQEHEALLCQHPKMLRHYYMRIAKCQLRVGNFCGLWWFIKAIILTK